MPECARENQAADAEAFPVIPLQCSHALETGPLGPGSARYFSIHQLHRPRQSIRGRRQHPARTGTLQPATRALRFRFLLDVCRSPNTLRGRVAGGPLQCEPGFRGRLPGLVGRDGRGWVDQRVHESFYVPAAAGSGRIDRLSVLLPDPGGLPRTAPRPGQCAGGRGHQAGARAGHAAGRPADGALRMARLLHRRGVREPPLAGPMALLGAARSRRPGPGGASRHAHAAGSP